MTENGPVNILLVDDQPAKLLSYEAMLAELGENLIKTQSAKEALETLLKNDIAVLLMDVCMPELDGFQLAEMIRSHPRFSNTAIIFISAIQLAEVDHLRGYQMGAVDYLPVPVIPEILRAKVKVFVELYRKTQELQKLNAELERRVTERTAELESSTTRLLESETRRNLALAAGQMGSWDWDIRGGDCLFDEGLQRIFGLCPDQVLSEELIQSCIHPQDWAHIRKLHDNVSVDAESVQMEFRVLRPDGQLRWCLGSAAASFDAQGALLRLSGVVVDITDRKEVEDRNALLAREVDHRARNILTVVQSILRLTRESTLERYVKAVEGRIRSLSQAHTLLAQSRWQGADLRKLVTEEMAAYRTGYGHSIDEQGPDVSLDAPTAQAIALALHELVTNAVKHGALSSSTGRIDVAWDLDATHLTLQWAENGGPVAKPPTARGFGLNVIHASIEGQLGGRVELNWNGEGLRCRLIIPMGEKMALASAGDGGQKAAPELRMAVPAPELARVFLVEDEAMVAMMVKDALDEIGLDVEGPFASVANAMLAAKTTDACVAILDVNLAGEAVYPVADVLRARGVPIILTTGYGGEDIDPRYKDVPILTKPFQIDQLVVALRRAEQKAAAFPAADDKIARLVAGAS